MREILDFPESNDKNQLQQLTPVGPRIPQQLPVNNAFSTTPTRAQIGWLDSSDISNALPTSQQGAAEKGPKRLDGPRTQHQPLEQQPQAQPRSANAAGGRLVDDFENYERGHRQPTYYHRHQRPRANVGAPRYHSPPRSHRNYTDRSRAYSSRDKVYSTREDRRDYLDSPKPEVYRYEREIRRPLVDLRPNPEQHGDYVSAREKVKEAQERQEKLERWEEEMREVQRRKRARSFAEAQQMEAQHREMKNAARFAGLERPQQSMDDEMTRQKLAKILKAEQARKIRVRQEREEGEAAIKRAVADQYKHQRQEEELRRRKLENLEKKFREKVQTELDNLLGHVKGLVLAHHKVEVDEAVDVAHVDKVTPTELSARRSVRKGRNTEANEGKL